MSYESLEAGKIRREDLFITTNLWNTNHRPERVQPGDNQDPRDEHGNVIYDSGVTLIETWRALERLVDEGRCRSIGLSDVTLPALQAIVAEARIKPAVVQVESHPY